MGIQSFKTPGDLINDNAGYQDYNNTWSAHKLLQMESEIVDLENDKLDEPALTGTAGQVLMLDNDLNPTWANQTAVALDATLTDPTKGAPANLVGDLKTAFLYDDKLSEKFISGKTSDFSKTTKITTGYYIADDGTITANASFWYTDFIPVNSDLYRIVIEGLNSTANPVRLHGYDSSKNWVSMIEKWLNISSTNEIDEIINITGVSYVRITSHNSKSIVFFGTALSPISDELDGYIRFETIGTTGANASSIDGLINAQVVDSNYEITLYYIGPGGTETNNGWNTYIDLTKYKTPTKLRIRRTDISAMPLFSANHAVKGTYLKKTALNDYVFKTTGIAFVDGTSGNDSNNGYTRDTAFATIQKAIDAGYKRILVRPGTYTSGIDLYQKEGYEISVDHFYSVFDEITANTNPKVIIDCNDTENFGVRIIYCTDCKLSDIEVIGAVAKGYLIQYSADIILNNCIVHDCDDCSGFAIQYTNADLYNCGAYNIGTYGGVNHNDGFGVSGTGTVNFFNCWANYCEDDGVSHHNACVGVVDGGEWHHCGKGGVATPTHGAKVDVRNVYCHDSAYGIYAGNDTADLAKTFTFTNCVCKNNTTKDIYVKNNTANIWNCIYDTIQHEGTGSNNVISASI